MSSRIRVAILEDHQSTIAGYYARLSAAPHLELVGAARSWSAFEALLAAQPVEVALLDLNVPAAPDDPNNFPVFNALPQLLQTYPRLALLVISMHAERALIEAVLATGVSGYILKDDAETLHELAAVITAVARVRPLGLMRGPAGYSNSGVALGVGVAWPGRQRAA